MIWTDCFIQKCCYTGSVYKVGFVFMIILVPNTLILLWSTNISEVYYLCVRHFITLNYLREQRNKELFSLIVSNISVHNYLSPSALWRGRKSWHKDITQNDSSHRSQTCLRQQAFSLPSFILSTAPAIG